MEEYIAGLRCKIATLINEYNEAVKPTLEFQSHAMTCLAGRV